MELGFYATDWKVRQGLLRGESQRDDDEIIYSTIKLHFPGLVTTG